MATDIHYTPRERFALWSTAGFGLLIVNGAFVLGALQPHLLREALANPIALVFLLEAALLLALLSYLLTKWRVMRVHWSWLVAMAVAGSLLFAIPVAVLWEPPGWLRARKRRI